MDLKSISVSTSMLLYAVIFVILCHFLNKIMRLFRDRREMVSALEWIPELPLPSNWLFGHLKELDPKEETYRKADIIMLDYPYFVKFWMGPFRLTVSLHHPDPIKAVLTTAEPKNELEYMLVRPWLGDGLLLSKGDKWHRNRYLLTPGFHYNVLKPYAKIFCQTSLDLVRKWSNTCKKGNIEVFHDVGLMTLDALFQCIFSQETHCQNKESNPYIENIYKIKELIMKRAYNPIYFIDVIYGLSPGGFESRKTIKSIHEYSMKVIQQRKQALKGNVPAGERKYVDFLDILLSAKDEDGNGLSDGEIRDEVDTFMFEGHDTTACALSWCLYHLAKHPDYQEKCRKEIDDLFSKKDKKELDWADLNNLKYITMCLKESLRLHPAVPYISRTLTKPLVLHDNKTVPKDSNIGIQIMNLHYNPAVWKNPYVYDPERFSSENIKKMANFSYIPFSAGPRNCIGQQFAMNEMKITVAMVVHHFLLSYDQSNAEPRRLHSLVLTAENGLHLRLKSLKNKI